MPVPIFLARAYWPLQISFACTFSVSIRKAALLSKAPVMNAIKMACARPDAPLGPARDLLFLHPDTLNLSSNWSIYIYISAMEATMLYLTLE